MERLKINQRYFLKELVKVYGYIIQETYKGIANKDTVNASLCRLVNKELLMTRRSDLTKQMMINAVEHLGYTPNRHDEACAIGIITFLPMIFYLF